MPAAEARQLNDQALDLMNAGQFEQALPLLQVAAPSLAGQGPDDPYEAYTNFNLGFTLLRLGRCEEAIPPLELSQSLQRTRDVLEEALGEARSCAGRGGTDGRSGDGDDDEQG